MTSLRPFRLLISLALVFSHVTALADDGLSHNPAEHGSAAIDANPEDSVDQPTNPFTQPHTFRVILPTKLESHVDGNAGSLMLNFESTAIDQMGEMIERARAKNLLPDWRKNPPTVYLYLPQDVYDHNRDDLVKEAIRSFHEVYPDIDPKIIVRVDQTNISVEAVYQTIRKDLVEGRDQAADAASAQSINQQIEILDLTYADVKGRFDFTAKRSRELKGKIAGFRAFFVFGSRLVTVLPAMVMGLGPATLALTMSGADAGLELFTATWSQRMQKFLSRNPLALKERTFFKGTKLEVRSEAINSAVSRGLQHHVEHPRLRGRSRDDLVVAATRSGPGHLRLADLHCSCDQRAL